MSMPEQTQHTQNHFLNFTGMPATALLPKMAKQRRRLYQGSIMNFHLLSKETNNAVSIIDTWTLAGAEPPRHIHTREDKVFIIHAGELVFFIGDDIITAGKGDVIFAPRSVAHHFKIT